MKSSNAILGKLALIALPILSSITCRTSPTGPHISNNLSLSTDYVTCTEVWLKLSYTARQAPNGSSDFRIVRDADTVLTGSLSGTDTVVIDTTTRPERTYTYKAFYLVNGQVSDTSQPLHVTTLDTTSNNFTWQTYTFGGNAGGSVLNDVAIINDTDIWAVGDIPIKDSSANGYSVYNLVKWDGHQWSLRQIMFPLCDPSGNKQNLQPFTCYGVAALSYSNVWLSGGGSLVHWQAGTPEPLCFSLGYGQRTLERMLGIAGDLYIVGTNGFAAYYDGYTWQQVANVTNLDVDDIWGVFNSTTGQSEVLAVASDEFTNDGVAVLQLSGTQATMLQTAGLPTTSIVGVWSADGKEWYVCGDGLYMTRNLNQTWQKIKSVPPVQMQAIRGTGPNNIYVVGDFGLALHWNGESWYDCTGNGLSYIQGSYLAVAANGNTVVAVGYSRGSPTNQPAVALIGRRN